MYAWPHELLIIRYGGTPEPGPYVEDDYGNIVLIPADEPGGTDEQVVPGFFGASTSTADFGNPDEPSRFVTTATVLVDPAADVRSGDDISYDDRLWRVVGEPLLITDLQGRPRHYEVMVAGYADEEMIGA